MKNAIEIKDLWKRYRIFHDHAPTLKERVLFTNRSKYEDLWVLKGVDISITKGQTVGLIGQNGSGKSTLLKAISKIIYPDRGSIITNGKISSLLELGAGFHPDFTGIENIYMNASIFGLTRHEIDDRIDEIIAFSELGDFVYSPVRTYSSGMYMRLAFSVAINVDPDILLIDEILTVGDESFQKKCLRKMQEFKQKKCTIVIVSHSMNDIKKICDEVIWLQDGVPKLIGETDYVVDQYRNKMLETISTPMRINSGTSVIEINNNVDSDANQSKNHDLGGRKAVGVTPTRWGTGAAEIYDVRIMDTNMRDTAAFNYGDEVIIRYSYIVHWDITDVVFGVGIFLRDGTRCYGSNSQIAKKILPLLPKGKEGTVTMRLGNLYLVNGEYVVNIAIHDKEGVSYDYHHRLYSFQITSNSNDIGIVRPNLEWQIF